MMAIYIGKDKKGKEKRDFELVNYLTAAKFYRRSNDHAVDGNQLIPQTKNGFPLRYVLKIGTMVLLYENSPEEIWDLDRANLQKRLYKVTGMSSMVVNDCNYGTLELVHHQDARKSTEITKKNGKYVSNELFRPGIRMLHTQFNALIEGIDFELNELGEIKRLI
jgi:CRISPR-associated endonuclease Csn1